MSTDAPSQPQSKSPKPKRINLRRPDVMEQVKAQVLTHYRSDLVDRLRVSGEVTSESARVTIKLAKEFGFCYGVERCIDLAYAALKVFPDKPLYILGEIIHNPEVNDQIRDMGIRFLSGPNKVADIDDLGADDIVIIPAFGTEVATLEKLKAKGCQFVDTTCGDVMSVWKRVRNYAKEEVTSIIHGKAYHEETKATSSQATSKNGHYLVVLTLQETDYVCDYIENGGDKKEFLKKFEGAFSEGFDPDQHLKAVGVANQTTMMRGETEEVQHRIKAAIERKFGAAKVDSHFRFFDTICGATQERQDALDVLLQKPMDLLLVIGGYNSSNTAHLAEMGEGVLPTYFIKNAAEMADASLIRHWNQHTNQVDETHNWLPDGTLTIGVTAGASCPNNLIEDVICRLLELRGSSADEFLPN
ncbi:MAG: 4-hydroxy-3-methylbut-2-enyl diphosphate reductase [Verrucomicrobiales bacterium]|nr:4-hydroxy-3-methylbut-2-enyl diphosphate reductase [Verrucomicrobiales bacterium]MBT5847289.1 4-hydroxy-3-methylbut-2-enyl diphosphate reductase [Verrucomicrobiales bacterium]